MYIYSLMKGAYTMKELAIEKIQKELKSTSGDQKANAVKKHVADTLIGFCRQDEEFAQAIMQADKTLGDCCKSIMAGCGSSISDLEVYRKAVQFYFPGADIRIDMTIDLCASVRGPEDAAPNEKTNPAPAAKSGNIVLDLADFL